MVILIFIILAICIIIFLCKKFNVNKKVIRTIAVLLFLIGMSVMLLDRFNVIDIVKYEIYKNQPTITPAEREQAIATIQYTNILGIDAQTYETCYIYKSTDNTYYYFITCSHTTIAGPQEEKINKKGNINSKKQLEKIVDNFEKKINSETSTMEYVTLTYDGQEVEKDVFFNKLFN